MLRFGADHVRPLVQFLALTGWRVSEAKSLRWSQVDHAGGVIRLEVGTTKTGAGRIFPFTALPALASLIRSQREWTNPAPARRLEACRQELVLLPRQGFPLVTDGRPAIGWVNRAGFSGELVT
jgi:integrase